MNTWDFLGKSFELNVLTFAKKLLVFLEIIVPWRSNMAEISLLRGADDEFFPRNRATVDYQARTGSAVESARFLALQANVRL
jgi:hypothetical protein